jgi:hypothetical protein
MKSESQMLPMGTFVIRPRREKILITTRFPPVILYLVFRIAWIAVRNWHTRKGGLAMITLKLPRLTASVPPVPAVAPIPRASLCAACLYAHIVRGYVPGEQMIFCGYAYPQREIVFPVRECTDYKPKRERDGAEKALEGVVSFPPLEEMAEQFCAVAATRGGKGE